MNDTTLGQVAREFGAACRTKGVISAHAIEDLESFWDAYRLQERVREELGAKVVGWKLPRRQRPM